MIFVLALAGCTTIPVAVAPTATPSPAPTVVPTPTPDPDVLAFPNGHTVRGAFRRFWQARDGATLFGAPLTEALWIDGRWVQHFERARFEQQADGSIALGDVGRAALQAQQGAVPAAEPIDRADCRFFVQTAHNLCGSFLQYWQQQGGEAIFGAPITELAITDRSEVQYFERARFEKPLGGALRLAPVGDEALARLPAQALLRDPGQPAASQQATLVPVTKTVQPLETVQTVLETEPVSATATLVWGDRRGYAWTTSTAISGQTTPVETIAQGALGPQGAAIMIDGQIAGVSTNVYQLDAASAITTGQPRFDELLPRVKAFMEQDISEYTFGPNTVRGYRSPDNNLLWLRDHVQQGKGYAYWERDMTSLLDQFRRYQRPDGSFDDYLGNFAYGEVRGRKEVEADLEYLFVAGVFRAWQATGDDAWMARQIDAMERGLRYATSDPLRWDAARKLVKRPYTIDTWDFEIGQPTIAPDGRTSPRHWIDEQTKWCIFHGDNTGYAQAMRSLATMYDRLGDQNRAAYWRGEADGLIARLNALSWNGAFYRHMVCDQPVDLAVDQAQQLSLSNAYALNRGVLSAEQATAILNEYQARRRTPDLAFAEWYSIDPPFPANTTSIPPGAAGNQPGEYVNGGIMPLVGGELAQGAFRWGQEAYGFDILQRYYSLIAGTGKSYLWYYPIGQPGISGPDTLPTDGWGASAMLAGLIEGAAGVTDDSTLFAQATLAPRWAATPDVNAATVVVRYGASAGYVAYLWERDGNTLRLRWTGGGDNVRLHVLLPSGAGGTPQVTLNDQGQAANIVQVGASRYVDLQAPASGVLQLSW